MGLSSTVQKAAQTAFKAIGDIPLTCTYTSLGTQTYDATYGDFYSQNTDYSNLKIVFEDFNPMKVADSGGAILATDKKLSIPQLSLTPTPKLSDYITDSDGFVWRIKDILTDPARALWLFQARRTA